LVEKVEKVDAVEVEAEAEVISQDMPREALAEKVAQHLQMEPMG
jgi:hypothetical protein